MARITDENKLIKIKKTLLDLIVKDGTSNASIAKMAKTAGVSSGYLYRHYDSKESLLKDLYIEKFNQINIILLKEIEQNKNLHDFLIGFYSQVVELSKTYENEVLFLLKMMTDYSIKITEDMQNEVSDTINIFKTKYHTELNQSISEEQIFTQVLGTILYFINMRKREVFTSNPISEKDIKSFSQMVLNALK